MKKTEKLMEYWATHIAKWKDSNLSQVEYCKKNNLMPHRFTYWKRRLSLKKDAQKETPTSFSKVITKAGGLNQKQTDPIWLAKFIKELLA